jgi:ubiquinol-cytochrome c reductase cytochrome b subunit
MLRAVTYPLFGVDAKFWGVVVMGAGIAVLFVLPWLDRSPVKSIRYKGIISKVMLVVFAASFVALGFCGSLAAADQPSWLAPLATTAYFVFFLAMPWYSKMESTKPVPERVTG